MGARGGGNLSAQAALHKRISQQNKFLDVIKSQLQILYDRHEDFNDFILSDDARESLLRHISVATRKPTEAAGETSLSVADSRPRSAQREGDRSITIDTSVTMGRTIAEVGQPEDSNQRHGDNGNWARGLQGPDPYGGVLRPRNTQMASLGNRIESLTGGVDAQAEFITER